MTRVRLADLRVNRYCFAGARAWFRRRDLLEAWDLLRREGLPAAVLEPFAGDAMVARVLETARRREELPSDG